MRPVRDAELVQILDASLADTTERAQKPDGSSWLACRPGCTPCCYGVFRISALDAERLLDGLRVLQAQSPGHAHLLRQRARHLAGKLAAHFPGDPATGILSVDEAAWDRFADLPAADAPCPALDPATGRCDLYAHRPMTCRVFGPPVQGEGGLGICELCYVGASEADIFGGELHLTHQNLETQLNSGLPSDETVIAWALVRENAPVT